MDIEKKCEVPANSLFFSRAENREYFSSHGQSNPFLVRTSIQNRSAFFGDHEPEQQGQSKGKFFNR